MKQQTIDAIKAALAAAKVHDYELVCTADKVTLDIICSGEDDDGPYSFVINSITVHKLNTGRWIRAHWNNSHNQWQSSDLSAGFSRVNRQACYCFARTLEGLAGDIKTYRSAVDAVRAAIG